MEQDAPERGWLPAVTIVVLVAAPNLWATLWYPAAFGSGRLAAWWGMYGVYAVSFAACVWWALPSRRCGAAIVLIGVQTLASIGANGLIPTVIPGVATGGALLVVVASQLARFPVTLAVPWVMGQHVALTAIYLFAWPTPIALVAGIAFAVFSFVILSMERLALREQRLRLHLGRTLAELSGARQILETQARDSERLRIARDLHDLLGHHLVALSLQLQLAERGGPEEARVSITRASSLTRLLLGDLRAVVADLREQTAPDLLGSLRAMEDQQGTPQVKVRIDIDSGVPEGMIAETVIRAAQELVTNARKHARATEIVVAFRDGELVVEDNGVGGPIVPATGMQGLNERLDAVGGALLIEHPDRGTRVRVTFPAAEPCEVTP